MSVDELRTTVRELLDEALAEGLPAGWDDDAPLADLGLDSVAVLNLVAGIEDRLGFTLADEDLDARHFASVRGLVALLARREGSA